jgi:hypothetical protein
VSREPGQVQILDVARGPGPLGEPLAQAVEWQQVIAQLNASGRERDGNAWRERAAKPDACLSQRTLLELYAYSQRPTGALKVMPDEPLQVIDALALSRYHDLLDPGGLIDGLLEFAADHVGLGPVEPWTWQDFRGLTFRGAEPPEWAKGFVAPGGEASLQLWYSWTDDSDRPDDARNQPIFLASLVIEPPSEEGRIALRDAVWTANEWAFPTETKKDYRISAIKYLAEVATSGVTLSSQAEALGAWARTSVDRLRALTYPPSAQS